MGGGAAAPLVPTSMIRLHMLELNFTSPECINLQGSWIRVISRVDEAGSLSGHAQG